MLTFFNCYYSIVQANIYEENHLPNMFASWNKLTLSLSIPVRQEVVWCVYLARPHDQYMLPAVLFKAEISSDVIAVGFTVVEGNTVHCHVHSEIGFRGQYKSCVDCLGNVQSSAMALVRLAFTTLDNMGAYHEDSNNCLVRNNSTMYLRVQREKKAIHVVLKYKAIRHHRQSIEWESEINGTSLLESVHDLTTTFHYCPTFVGLLQDVIAAHWMQKLLKIKENDDRCIYPITHCNLLDPTLIDYTINT